MVMVGPRGKEVGEEDKDPRTALAKPTILSDGRTIGPSDIHFEFGTVIGEIQNCTASFFFPLLINF